MLGMNNAKKTKLLLKSLQQNLIAAFQAGDASAASSVIDKAWSAKLAWEQIYLGLLMPSLREIGALWRNGKASVAEEHMATQICLELMVKVRARVPKRAPLHLKAVISCVEGNQHILGARVVADFLDVDGWDIHFLGASTPAKDLLRHVLQVKPALVGLSVFQAQDIPALKECLKLLKSVPQAPKILVGGPIEILVGQDLMQAGADAVAFDAVEAQQSARKLLQLPTSQVSVEQYLRELGNRIASRRKELQLNQSALAESAGLDRTYLSTVEHGKQNVTIGVVARLATALGLPLEELLLPRQIP